ncbi:MAG: exopolysaccharide biosynthesis polyprenyl glycosylphosphotransferase [Actinomycetota bacterium]|nr:exopolysaccharide biosynthesis polyprenyl glycosylphosphotransferase [Actinomycetota bacterium]
MPNQPQRYARALRASDRAPVFPPTDVPLLEALPYAAPDPVTRLRRILSLGDALFGLVLVAFCLLAADAVTALAVTVLLAGLWKANDRQKPSKLVSGSRTVKWTSMTVGAFGSIQIFTATPAAAQQSIVVITLFGVCAVLLRLLVLLPPVSRRLAIDWIESVLLVGDFPTVSNTIQRWTARKARVRISGVLLTDAPGGVERRTAVEGVEVYGQLKDTAPAACDLGVSKVVFVGETVHSTTLRRISWELDRFGIPVALATRIEGIRPHRSAVDIVGDQTIVELEAVRRRTVLSYLWSVVERVAAAALLLVLSPALIVVGLWIRMDSPGPAVFRQLRAGQFGKPFPVYKFRSMRVDAEDLKALLVEQNESDGVLFKIRRDPRITSLGGFLRRSSIDELPQLWNVVRGEMSLIGPRPHVIAEADAYDTWAQRRLMVKPGLTGLWQVSGRSDLGWDESVSHDLDYVDNWRPGLDLGIAFRTFGAVFRRDGAY